MVCRACVLSSCVLCMGSSLAALLLCCLSVQCRVLGWEGLSRACRMSALTATVSSNGSHSYVQWLK